MTTNEIYLNHAGTSWPKPQVVLDAVKEAMSAEPATWPRRFDDAHQAIAEFFGVNQRAQLLLTPGCTSALAIGIGDALIPSGHRVLTSCWEHHALHRPLLKLADKGVRVEYIPSQTNELIPDQKKSIDLDWLERELAVGDVGLVAITAACNVTGELLPYEKVIQLSHRYGAMVMIDAAQVVGWLKLDLDLLGADLVAFGGHKGLQGPWGIGGLYFSDQARMECAAANCELPSSNAADVQNIRRPSYCDVGSVDQFALAGLFAAVKFLGQQDTNSNLATARMQIKKIRKTLERCEGIRIFGSFDEGMPTIALAISGFQSGEVATHWKRHGLLVGSGVHCAPLAHETLGTPDSGLVRLSVGLGQPDHEIDEAIDRIMAALNDEKFCSAKQTDHT